MVDVNEEVVVDVGRHGSIAELVDDGDGDGATDRDVVDAARHTLDDLQVSVVRREISTGLLRTTNINLLITVVQ